MHTINKGKNQHISWIIVGCLEKYNFLQIFSPEIFISIQYDREEKESVPQILSPEIFIPILDDGTEEITRKKPNGGDNSLRC